MSRFLLLLCVAGLAACAPQDRLEYESRPDMDKIQELLNCPSDRMPTCIERIGKPYTCYCMDEEAMRKILEPDKY
jgi:hypothetical protein